MNVLVIDVSNYKIYFKSHLLIMLHKQFHVLELHQNSVIVVFWHSDYHNYTEHLPILVSIIHNYYWEYPTPYARLVHHGVYLHLHWHIHALISYWSWDRVYHIIIQWNEVHHQINTSQLFQFVYSVINIFNYFLDFLSCLLNMVRVPWLTFSH